MSNALKAIVGGLISGLSSIVTGLGDNTLSTQEIVTAVLAALVAFAAVYGVSNTSKGGGG